MYWCEEINKNYTKCLLRE